MNEFEKWIRESFKIIISGVIENYPDVDPKSLRYRLFIAAKDRHFMDSISLLSLERDIPIQILDTIVGEFSDLKKPNGEQTCVTSYIEVQDEDKSEFRKNVKRFQFLKKEFTVNTPNA